MTKDILFLLAPGFFDNDRREYCPECAEMWGLLHYFPSIMEAVDIRYQPIARPRPDLAGLLGQAHQNCPTLILADHVDAGPFASVQVSGDIRFLDNVRDIGKYFAYRYGTPFPRGS